VTTLATGTISKSQGKYKKSITEKHATEITHIGHRSHDCKALLKKYKKFVIENSITCTRYGNQNTAGTFFVPCI
jgi:hypothetical protein